MFITRFARMTIATLYVCLAAAASAQGDERARELLGGVMTVPQPDVHTLQQTASITFGGEVMSETLYVVDFDNRRAVVRSALGGMTTVMRHEGGETRMFMDGEEYDMTAVPGIVDPFEWVFDVDELDVDLDDATYDGFVTYGDVLSGEQVTSSAMLSLFGLPVGSSMSYVFGPDGELLGGVGDASGVTTIVLFEGPYALGAGWSAIDGASMTMYTFDGTTATLAGTVTWDPAIINEPLDESLFD